MRSIKTLFCAAALVLLISGCGKVWSAVTESVQGDGNIAVETRQLAHFASVDLEGDYEVILTQGAESSIKLEGDKNLLPLVSSDIKAGKLVVGSKSNLSPTKRIKVYVTTPDYSAVDVEGSATVHATTPIKSENLTLGIEGSGSYDLEVHATALQSTIEGSGKITLRGSAESHKVNIDGSGDIGAADLPAETADIDISGSGNALVAVTKRLDASISGSGHIRYKGTGAEIHSSVSGSGKIEKVD